MLILTHATWRESKVARFIFCRGRVARGHAGVRGFKGGELIFAAHEFPREKSTFAPIDRESRSPSDLRHARILAGDR